MKSNWGNENETFPLRGESASHQPLLDLMSSNGRLKWCEALSPDGLRAKNPKSPGKAGTSTFLQFINDVSISNLENFPEKTLGEFMSSFISCKFQLKTIVVGLETK